MLLAALLVWPTVSFLAAPYNSLSAQHAALPPELRERRRTEYLRYGTRRLTFAVGGLGLAGGTAALALGLFVPGTANIVAAAAARAGEGSPGALRAGDDAELIERAAGQQQVIATEQIEGVERIDHELDHIDDDDHNDHLVHRVYADDHIGDDLDRGANHHDRARDHDRHNHDRHDDDHVDGAEHHNGGVGHHVHHAVVRCGAAGLLSWCSRCRRA